MFRSELVERLLKIRDEIQGANFAVSTTVDKINRLTDDIGADGVLDVQAPKAIAESLKLPNGQPVTGIQLERIRDNLWNAQQTGVREILFIVVSESIKHLTLLTRGIRYSAPAAAAKQAVLPFVSGVEALD